MAMNGGKSINGRSFVRVSRDFALPILERVSFRVRKLLPFYFDFGRGGWTHDCAGSPVDRWHLFIGRRHWLFTTPKRVRKGEK